MRALVQRVKKASVSVDGGEPRPIGRGLLVYLGVGREDGEAEAKRLSDKVLAMRIFPNDEGKFDKSVVDVGGELLVVSQFTLYGDVWTGRRPDFTKARKPDEADALYKKFVEFVAASGLSVKTGEFGAKMLVDAVNDGPINLWIDTADA